MILLFGPRHEPCLSRIRDTLVRRGARVARFDADELTTRCAVTYRIASGADGATLDTGGVRVDGDDISAALVWSRDPPLVPADQRTRDRMYQAFEWHAALGGLWELLGHRVLNRRDVAPHTRPHVGEVMRAAAAAGFTLPDFAISTDRVRIETVAERHAGRVHLSSLSGRFPDVLSPDAAHRRALAEDYAVIVQSVPSGQWWRTYVVGDVVLGLTLSDDGADATAATRTGPGPMLEPRAVAEPTAERCRRFARALGLDYAQVLVCRTASEEDEFHGYGAHLAVDPSITALIDGLAARVADLIVRRTGICEPPPPPLSS
jgi:hypothetical protein